MRRKRGAAGRGRRETAEVEHDVDPGADSRRRDTLTLAEAQRTGVLDEFIRQQEDDLMGREGSRSQLLTTIQRMILDGSRP